jgi:hypothetical protein
MQSLAQKIKSWLYIILICDFFFDKDPNMWYFIEYNICGGQALLLFPIIVISMKTQFDSQTFFYVL